MILETVLGVISLMRFRREDDKQYFYLYTYYLNYNINMGNRQHLPLHQSNNSPVSLNTSSNLHQEPLIASVSSPSPEAGILSTPTLTSDVHIMSETISLTSNSVSNIYYISGCLSCTTECILNIYYFTAEEVTHEGVTTRYIYNESKPSEPISVRYSAGMNQQISPELISVDSDKYSAEELCLSEGRTYPVILEIVTLN